MKTKIFDITALSEETIRRAQVLCEPDAIDAVELALANVSEAATILRNGGIVAFPTETVYGLGGNALDEDVVRRIYSAKGRPSDNPMIVHIARASDISQLTDSITPDAMRLADRFWPGPLTMIFKKSKAVPYAVTGGLDTVAVRLPDNPSAVELIRRCGVPVAAPSANLSGKPSPTKAKHVIQDLDGRIDAILAGESCRIGIESTVVDLTSKVPTVLRPGIISAYDISLVLGKEVDDYVSLDDAPRSPGMKYKHYSPKAEMILIDGRPESVRKEAMRLKDMNEHLGRKVGVILYDDVRDDGNPAWQSEEAAKNYYAKLREMDETDTDLIIAGAIPDSNPIAFALMNRMRKSAGDRLIYV